MICPICSGDACLAFCDLYDDRYGYPGLYDIFACNSCGHLFLDADFAQAELSNLYTNYYPRRTFDVENYTPHQEARGFRAWLNGNRRSAYLWVPRNVRVLDIGCGFGESLGYHAARGCDVYGVEADENIRRVADRYGFQVQVGVFDPALFQDNYFDVLTMDQVIEHVANPLDVFRGISRVLKPGGLAILSTPNPEGWGSRVFRKKWINWHVPYHLHHFSSASLDICADTAGLVVEARKTITSSEWLYYQWLHLMTCPKEGSPSVFWNQQVRLRDLKTWVKYLPILLHRLKVNLAITRCMDAMGVGDNRLIFLRKPKLP